MALLSDLVRICADLRIDSEGTLNVFARRLREAGRLSQAGRGRGAAHMTYLDAARFLIACAATDHPERAADAEFEFSNTIYHGDHDETDGMKATLDLAVADVLQCLADGTIDDLERAERAALIPRADEFNIPVEPVIWLVVHRSSVQAELRVRSDRLIYQHRGIIAMSKASAGQDLTERAKDYEHATARFRGGKNLRAQLDGKVFRTVANLIAGIPAARSTEISASVSALLETYR